MINLTKEEKNKMIIYLNQSADGNDQLVEQMKKLPNTKLMIRKYSAEASAMRVVVKIFDSTEEVTIDSN